MELEYSPEDFLSGWRELEQEGENIIVDDEFGLMVKATGLIPSRGSVGGDYRCLSSYEILEREKNNWGTFW